MDISAHQWCYGCIHEAVAGDGGESDELGAADEHVEVAALAGAGVAGMQRTVIADFQQIGFERRLQASAQSLEAWGVCHAAYDTTPVQHFELHPLNPQLRLIRQAATIVREGGLIAYPTDSCYALGCHIGDKDALERIRRLRQADRHHHFTLVCRDLTEIARYAKVDTWQFRLLKACTPGPYTFILEATRETPRRLQHEKRRTIGIRVPDHPVPQMLLTELGEPIMSSTLMLPGDELPLNDGAEIASRLARDLDALLDSGSCGLEPTTVVDLAASPAVVVRQGRGSIEPFGL